MTIAMLEQIAPKASTPPSPKNKAWIASATLTAITAAHGPSHTAISPAPTTCAVVPSGTGMLNIMTRKQYEAPNASNGTYRCLTTVCTRLAATSQHGAAAPYMTAHVSGLRYPSGMCTCTPAAIATRLHRTERTYGRPLVVAMGVFSTQL